MEENKQKTFRQIRNGTILGLKLREQEYVTSKSASIPSSRRKPESRALPWSRVASLGKSWMPACAGMTDLHFV